MPDLPPGHASDIDGLIAAHLDDSLEPPQAERLFASLKADARARRTLLASAVQASALARDALDAGPRSIPGTPAAKVARRAVDRTHGRWIWAAMAAGLVAAAALWWTTADRGERLLRVDSGVATTATRGGSPRDLAADPWLRAGDHLVVGAGEAKLSWPDEHTEVTIGSGSEVDVVSVRAAKQLRLSHGHLAAAVASQGAGRGFSIATARGEVSVIGTRFAVAADDRATSVHVDHGVVKVAPTDGAEAAQVEAGSDAVCDGEGPIRVIASPKTATPSTPSAQRSVRIDAASFAAYTDRLGTVVGDAIVAAKGDLPADASVVKVQIRAPGGDLMPLGPDFEVHASIDVDQPTTVSLLLVYEHPERSGSWMGNVQAERMVEAGTHDLVFKLDEFVLKVGEASISQAPGRVSMAVVMAYSPTVRLVLHGIEFRGSTPGR